MPNKTKKPMKTNLCKGCKKGVRKGCYNGCEETKRKKEMGDYYCYLVNERTERWKGVSDFHERCWTETAILNEILNDFLNRIEKEIECKIEVVDGWRAIGESNFREIISKLRKELK